MALSQLGQAREQSDCIAAQNGSALLAGQFGGLAHLGATPNGEVSPKVGVILELVGHQRCL
jgi:hypothetical protein